MKKSKEYKISMGLFVASLAFNVVAFVTGLIPQLDYSIDKICMGLGLACLGFGMVYFQKLRKNDGNK